MMIVMKKHSPTQTRDKAPYILTVSILWLSQVSRLTCWYSFHSPNKWHSDLQDKEVEGNGSTLSHKESDDSGEEEFEISGEGA